jgi:hypothetical protein
MVAIRGSTGTTRVELRERERESIQEEESQ